MKKQIVETIATMVEGLLTANKSIVFTSVGRIRYVRIDANNRDMGYLLKIATLLTNSALKDGLCSLDSLKKSFTRNGPVPDPQESFEVERTNFKIGCFVYKLEKEVHLMIFKKR